MSDCSIIKAIQDGVDHAGRHADDVWGAGRLPMLVSDQTRIKFAKQQLRWRHALETAWNAKPPLPLPVQQALEAASGGMQRAYVAMAVEAQAAGHQPLTARRWETSLSDGTVVVITPTVEEAISVTKDGRQLAVYSLDEIANIIDTLGALNQAKAQFEGSRVGRWRGDYSWVEHGDPLPF